MVACVFECCDNACMNPIDAYIKASPKDVQAVLQQVRKAIRSVLPKADEVMSYGIPTFDVNKRHIVHFAAFKKHIGLFPGPSAIVKFKKEFAKYETSKGTVQFPLDKPMPLALIKKVAAWRLKEEMANVEAKKSASKKPKMKNEANTEHRVYAMTFSSVYPLYVTKAERKGRTKAEVDECIRWLTGYTQKQLESQIKKQVDFRAFFAEAKKINPSRKLITGVVCGVRIEELKEPLMREIRYLDKLVDELAKGRPMEKILRKA